MLYMKIGVMNNPYETVYSEIVRIGKAGFDYVDLTIEPEKAMPEQVDAVRVRKMLKKYNLGVVGHLGDWRLP